METSMRWGMVVEMKRCIGCNACVLACKAEHFIPPGILWNRVLISETGKYPAVTKHIYSVRCNHCAEAKCVDVCPTGATATRDDGIVWVDEDKCVGCRYCIVACPYQVRMFYSDSAEEYFPGQGLTDFEKMGQLLYPHQKGVVQKCNFCMERIDAGLEKGLKPGIDREATPACVIACPTSALHFGNLDDPYNEASMIFPGGLRL
jgi:molybdopterin-containing oxidoreductase family iron-sulfur binding subunit